MKIVGLLIALAGLVVCQTPALLAQDKAFESQRLKMVSRQIEARGVADKAVLKAMRTVPRHLFVPPHLVDEAYDDRPLPIGYGQTISQPFIVAYMTEVLGLTGREKVLEIGTGSGYQAAVLAHTAQEVYSVEIIPQLHARSKKLLADLGLANVFLKAGDGYFGWAEKGPFDGIIVTCAAGHIPPPLLRQLKPGGRMVIPVGRPWFVQDLVLAKKKASGQVQTQTLMAVRFVPLVRAGE
ncbi:MAG: protein-L-isoaspartate(D-aspartate) O-methyltransferase [Deltaproteobacteria bacterium]|nr:protein-L-isoaspartate(D-aspartate) O-methyltransferase [Deltaproteobacteria bacterium]